MRRPIASVLFLFGISTVGLAGAQPGRTAALEKARTKFEADITKAEEALLASMDKALKVAQTAKDKPAVEKLTYEREQFVKQRLVPTTVPTLTYLKQRAQSIAALEAAYQPAIKDLLKAKKDEEVEALETALNDLVKSRRGYGRALPDLEGKPTFVIENKANGMVVETTDKNGRGELVLGSKVGKKKPNQCWQLEREEKGYIIRNVASRWGFHVPYSGSNPGAILTTWPPHEASKETIKGSLYKLAEVRNEIVITPAWNELVLSTTEKQVKGVTTTFVVQEKKDTSSPSKQRWVLTEAK
jgi:hypothetical protein